MSLQYEEMLATMKDGKQEQWMREAFWPQFTGAHDHGVHHAPGQRGHEITRGKRRQEEKKRRKYAEGRVLDDELVLDNTRRHDAAEHNILIGRLVG